MFGLVNFLLTPGLSAWTVVVGFLPLMALTAPTIVRNPFFFVSLAFTLPQVAGNFLGLPEAHGRGPFNTHGTRQLPLPVGCGACPLRCTWTSLSFPGTPGRAAVTGRRGT